MRYCCSRHRIQSGDIILWTGRGMPSKVVRHFTKSDWSHIGIAAWFGPRLMVLDSFPFRGTRVKLLSHMLRNAYWMPSGAQWNDEALGFALDELGKRYGWQNLWKTWLGLDLVAREYHCSQYAAKILERAGLKFSWPPTPASVARDIGGAIEPLTLEDVSSCGCGGRHVKV